jgi:hydroxymethylpyrimidine/phosphomethylpyrimidine kinase
MMSPEPSAIHFLIEDGSVSNLVEAAALTEMPVESLRDAREAARRLLDFGPAAALVKGGHLPGEKVCEDISCTSNLKVAHSN